MCREGARGAQKLLNEHPDAEVRLYSVWFPVLGGDARSTWDPDLLHDPRVTNYWDQEGIVSRWLQERDEQLGLGSVGAGILWDAYLVFSPDARLGGADGPSQVTSWAAPVVSELNALESALFDQAESS